MIQIEYQHISNLGRKKDLGAAHARGPVLGPGAGGGDLGVGRAGAGASLQQGLNPADQLQGVAVGPDLARETKLIIQGGNDVSP